MNAQSTVDILKSMRFGAMAKELERQMDDAKTYGQLPFEERLAFLVDAEWNTRQANKLNRLIRNARFREPCARIEEIEYHPDRKLDKAAILRYATCQYIEDHHHIIFDGAAGSGKTYIACALGNAACRKFKTVRYIRMPELLDELNLAQASGDFQKLVKFYRSVDLLIIDDWLIRCLTPNESYNLLEITEIRSLDPTTSAAHSTIFCSQFDTADWYDRITPRSDEKSTISDSIMDRIVHNAYTISIAGTKSMRERHGLKTTEEAK